MHVPQQECVCRMTSSVITTITCCHAVAICIQHPGKPNMTGPRPAISRPGNDPIACLNLPGQDADKTEDVECSKLREVVLLVQIEKVTNIL